VVGGGIGKAVQEESFGKRISLKERERFYQRVKTCRRRRESSNPKTKRRLKTSKESLPWRRGGVFWIEAAKGVTLSLKKKAGKVNKNMRGGPLPH